MLGTFQASKKQVQEHDMGMSGWYPRHDRGQESQSDGVQRPPPRLEGLLSGDADVPARGPSVV